jgi:hypothetical protein
MASTRRVTDMTFKTLPCLVATVPYTLALLYSTLPLHRIPIKRRIICDEKKISIPPDQQKNFFIIGRRVPKEEKEKRMQQTAGVLTATATHGQPDELIIDSCCCVATSFLFS